MYKLTEKQKKEFEFYKHHDDDKVMFVTQPDVEGRIEFTFDKETVYNFFADYPEKLTRSQRELFDKEQPFYKEHFGR